MKTYFKQESENNYTKQFMEPNQKKKFTTLLYEVVEKVMALIFIWHTYILYPHYWLAVNIQTFESKYL